MHVPTQCHEHFSALKTTSLQDGVKRIKSVQKSIALEARNEI